MLDHLNSPVASVLALTLLHFLWQGALIAAVYWGVIEAAGIRSVRTRYALSLATLCLMALAPLVTFCVTDQPVVAELPVVSVSEHLTASIESHAEPIALPHNNSFLNELTNAKDTLRTGTLHSSQALTEKASDALQFSQSTMVALLQWSKPYVLLLWLAGVMLSGARLTAGVLNVVWLRTGRQPVSHELSARAQKFARRLGLTSARVFSSDRVRTAAVAGFWKPVVLLPTSWLMSLPPDVVEAVIAHELAHIRRFDVWANLLQRFVETLLFYHPAVWWLSNRVRLEREMCCDELAIMATGERGNYAVALEQVGWLQTFGTPRLAPSFSGEKKMNLLSRIQNVLGGNSRPQREPAWLLGVVALALPLTIVGASGHFTDSSSAIAQEREGRRSAESDEGPRPSPEAEGEGRRRSAEEEAGQRRSPEAETGERRSPEAEAGRRRSAEADAGPRRSAERERGDARSPERDRPRDAEDREEDAFAEALGDFKPQTDREAVLFRMIEQLRREIAQIRRDVRSRDGGRGERDGDRGDARGERDGDRGLFREGRGDREDSRENREAGIRELPARWESSKDGRVFKAYDKNSDGSVSLDEWLAMTNGNASDARRRIQTQRYTEADRNNDGKFTPLEFFNSLNKGRSGQGDRARRDGDGDRRGARDGEESRRGPRDGDREETPRNTRDGDGERRGPREGDAEGRRGPRDGERESDGPRDGDREREGGNEDGDREE